MFRIQVPTLCRNQGEMGKKSKDLAKVELCKWDKGSYEKNLETVMDIVNNPRYICKTCGRAARLKKNLCKAVSLPDPPDSRK
jgi:hypothetical protein